MNAAYASFPPCLYHVSIYCNTGLYDPVYRIHTVMSISEISISERLSVLIRTLNHNEKPLDEVIDNTESTVASLIFLFFVFYHSRSIPLILFNVKICPFQMCFIALIMLNIPTFVMKLNDKSHSFVHKAFLSRRG